MFLAIAVDNLANAQELTKDEEEEKGNKELKKARLKYANDAASNASLGSTYGELYEERCSVCYQFMHPKKFQFPNHLLLSHRLSCTSSALHVTNDF